MRKGDITGLGKVKYTPEMKEQTVKYVLEGNKSAISSILTSTNITRSIQHELTHNLGGSHNTCTEGQYCVLKGNFNY
jgi:hypothetical protein